MEEEILCCGCAMACVLTLHTGTDGALTVGGSPCRKGLDYARKVWENRDTGPGISELFLRKLGGMQN